MMASSCTAAFSERPTTVAIVAQAQSACCTRPSVLHSCLHWPLYFWRERSTGTATTTMYRSSTGDSSCVAATTAASWRSSALTWQWAPPVTPPRPARAPAYPGLDTPNGVVLATIQVAAKCAVSLSRCSLLLLLALWQLFGVIMVTVHAQSHSPVPSPPVASSCIRNPYWIVNGTAFQGMCSLALAQRNTLCTGNGAPPPVCLSRSLNCPVTSSSG
jgi:hypothetical protein